MFRVASLIGCVMAVLAINIGAAEEPSAFATVSGDKITQAEFEAAVHGELRQRFYHGRVSEERLAGLRHQVAGQLIDRRLLLQEAKKRGVETDENKLAQQVANEASRFQLDKVTPDRKQHLLQMLQQRTREDALISALEAEAKAVPALQETEVRAYYEANRQKFTTPPQLRLSVILLKVAPSAPGSAWRAAEEEAGRLKRRLERGGDFAELARLHSGDASAEQGGDLGFVHQGMLSQEAQTAVDALKEGQVSEPVMMLQGVALFKLRERRDAVVNPFEQVKVRAKGLLQRERSARAWDELLGRLRSNAQIEIYDSGITITKIWNAEPKTNR